MASVALVVSVLAVGYAKMVDHRFLTPDRGVQQTVFANGVTVTVNFGDQSYRLLGGNEVGPMGFSVTGVSLRGAFGRQAGGWRKGTGRPRLSRQANSI